MFETRQPGEDDGQENRGLKLFDKRTREKTKKGIRSKERVNQKQRRSNHPTGRITQPTN